MGRFKITTKPTTPKNHLGGGFKKIFSMFTPKIGGRFPFSLFHMFQMGLVKNHQLDSRPMGFG